MSEEAKPLPDVPWQTGQRGESTMWVEGGKLHYRHVGYDKLGKETTRVECCDGKHGRSP